MIKYGTQTIDGRKEKYLSLRMPWKRRMYIINTDEVLEVHPKWLAIWSRPPICGGFKFRCGWVPDLNG